jgi:hypothetical protein
VGPPTGSEGRGDIRRISSLSSGEEADHSRIDRRLRAWLCPGTGFETGKIR